MSREPIDSDVRRAHTPPARFYLDSDVHALQVERVFARSWQWIGDESLLAADPSQYPFTLLPGSVDESLVLTRSEGRLRCLSNVCTHRAMPVCERAGTARGLRCRYHGRRFGLDGRFESAPGFDAALDFPALEDHLPEVSLEQLGALLFASLDPDLSFDTVYGAFAEHLRCLPLERARHQPNDDRDWAIDANWALYVENYLEGLHIPYIHPGLTRTLEFSKYAHVLLPAGTLQVGVAAEGEPAFEPDAIDASALGAAGDTRIAALYFWLFPNLMINAYPWGLSLNVVEPCGPTRTRVRFRSYVVSPELRALGAGGDLDSVEREDEAAVEAVQRGLRSRLYRRGRYAPEHEIGTHHFHRLLQERLGPGAFRAAPQEPT